MNSSSMNAFVSIHGFLSDFLAIEDETRHNALEARSAFQQMDRVIGIGKNAPGPIGSPAQVGEEVLLNVEGSVRVLISRHLT